MQAIVEGYLAALKVGEGIHFDRMTLFPLFRDGASPLRYRVLADALANGAVEVRERPSASVPELWLVNRSDEMVLVLDGEEVIGGKQNRIANATFLVAPRSEVALPVSCVERGRWHDVAPSFETGEASYFSLRLEKEGQVRANLRTSGRAEADQAAVWDAIAAKESEAGVQSPTGAMHDIFREKVADLSAYDRAFPPVQGAVGMAVALNGRTAGADLFDQPATAGRLWSKLVRSYAMDALDRSEGKSVARERVERLLKRLLGARVESYPSVSLGHDVRLEGDGAVGSGLVHEGVVVHLGVFRIRGERSRQGSTGIARASLRRGMQMRTELQQQQLTPFDEVELPEVDVQ